MIRSLDKCQHKNLMDIGRVGVFDSWCYDAFCCDCQHQVYSQIGKYLIVPWTVDNSVGWQLYVPEPKVVPKYVVSSNTVGGIKGNSIFMLNISSKCEGVVSGTVAYTTKKEWAQKWVMYNPEHRSYEEIHCADSEMEGAIDG